jgi:serine/threonine-protein kinase RsbW
LFAALDRPAGGSCGCLSGTSMARIHEFQVEIPAEHRAIRAVQERVAAVLDDLHYSAADKFSVRLALEEALVNAIEHGNQMDAAKSVRIHCRASAQKIRLEVEDRGWGFCRQQVPCPTLDENLEKPNGRGIKLMRELMSLLEYNERGNLVIMEKHCQPLSVATES